MYAGASSIVQQHVHLQRDILSFEPYEQITVAFNSIFFLSVCCISSFSHCEFHFGSRMKKKFPIYFKFIFLFISRMYAIVSICHRGSIHINRSGQWKPKTKNQENKQQKYTLKSIESLLNMMHKSGFVLHLNCLDQKINNPALVVCYLFVCKLKTACYLLIKCLAFVHHFSCTS